MDHFLEEYFWKPSAIACYSAGAFGGVRAAMTLRPMLAEMGMARIPSILPIPALQDAFDDDGASLDDNYPRRATRFLAELEWYAYAMKTARAPASAASATPGFWFDLKSDQGLSDFLIYIRITTRQKPPT
jgi:NAD(P)H-dependent FMN reductase